MSVGEGAAAHAGGGGLPRPLHPRVRPEVGLPRRPALQQRLKVGDSGKHLLFRRFRCRFMLLSVTSRVKRVEGQ